MDKQVKPYKTKLDAGNAYWMARISKEVYAKVSDENSAPDENLILQRLTDDDTGFKSVTGFNHKSSQSAVIEHDDYICLAFRGTDEIKDWFDNLNGFATKQLFGEFHRGFWDATEDVWVDMMDKLEQCMKEKKRPVFFTGHSLGGAMATVAASKFINEDRPFTSVYTFGQPRAVTRDTSRVLNSECKSRYFRFHNNNDIVTRIPARLMGYSHVGEYFYISEEEEIHRDPGFWFRFVDNVDGIFSSITEEGIDAFKDHDMSKYLAFVKKWDYQD